MAFPVVEATNTSTQAFSTSHTVSLPAGIQADELLLVFFDISSNSTVTFPAGWTKFVEHVHSVNLNNKLVVAWRKATGGEGGSITVTSNNADRSAHNSYRISGAEDPTSQAPQGAANNGSNPPSLTPTGGAKEYLWIAAHGHNNTDLVTAPANYSVTLEARLTDTSCFSARRNLNAASEDPGAWGGGGQTGAVSATVAVHPAALSAALSGTVTDDTEADIRAGGSTIVLTLDGGIWAAAGATFDAERQGIIDGIASGSGEPQSWDAVVQPAIPVGNVVRTSDTVVTITLPAVGSYEIEDEETVTATIPATAIQEASDPVEADPPFTIINVTQNAFPEVLTTAQSTQLDGADRTLDLPAGIEAGNLLLLFLWIGNGSSVVDDPAGWTSIQNVTNNPTTGIIHRRRVLYRQADGNEGSSLALHISSGSTTVDTKSIVLRITGHRSPDIHPPETSGVNENPSGQQTANPDPPSLSPTGGAKDYLWLAFATWGNSGSSQTDVSSFPSNYTGGIQEGPAGGPEDGNMGVAQRDRFIATEDPGVFTLGTQVDWLASTVAVPPDFELETLVTFGPLPAQQQALLAVR